MKEEDVQLAYDVSAARIRDVETGFHRYLYAVIDWDVRILALNGPRGVGKTTMFLQYLKEHPSEAETSLYLSLDTAWLEAREIFELAKYHVEHGGTRIFLDEVHYLNDWQRLVKNLYDNFKGLRIAYTGSSILRMAEGQGDLSRRQVAYTLTGMSFREYLQLEGVCDLNPVKLSCLLKNHVALAEKITDGVSILPHFEAYLRHGYYPFYREDVLHFPEKLRQVVNQVLDVDLPKAEDVTPETVRKIRKMLTILAASTPQTPRLGSLCTSLGMDWRQGIKVIYALRRAGILGLLAEDAEALKHLGAPSKIYCDNTNLMSVLSAAPDKGTGREAFFNGQLSVCNQPTYPKYGDFLVDGKYLFEVGGAKKTFRQIRDIPNSFLAVDETEVGRGNRIPLWLFGFLY